MPSFPALHSIRSSISGFPPTSKDTPAESSLYLLHPALPRPFSFIPVNSRKSPSFHSFNMLKVTDLYMIKFIQYLQPRFPFELQTHTYHSPLDLSLDYLKISSNSTYSKLNSWFPLPPKSGCPSAFFASVNDTNIRPAPQPETQGPSGHLCLPLLPYLVCYQVLQNLLNLLSTFTTITNAQRLRSG